MKKITFLITFLTFSFLSFAQNTILNFDGTAGASVPSGSISGQLVYTTPMIPLTNSFTLMGWINTNTANTSIFVWGSSTVNKYIQLQTRFDKKIRIYAASGVISLDSSTAMDGNWHHIAVTNNSGAVTLYVDGVSENNTTADFSSINPTLSSFGTALINNAYQGSYTGSIDEFSIWNVALSAAQIAIYKDTPPMGSESGLVAAYDFNPAGVTPGGDNTTITELADLTGNYEATLAGFPLTGSTGNYILSTNTVLGINDFDLKNTRFVIPNPVSNYIKIKGIDSETNYSVYSLLGSRVLKGSVNVGDVININPLTNGLYILSLDNNQSFKFIKN